MPDIQSSDKGLLLPRLTTLQMRQITNPAIGLIVFNIDSVDIYMFNGTYWLNLRENANPINPCPDIEYGWHVPSNAGFTLMTYYVGNNPGTNNAAGFSLPPGGSHFNGGYFDDFSVFAFLWTSTDYDINPAQSQRLFYNTSLVNEIINMKVDGISVRCVMDN